MKTPAERRKVPMTGKSGDSLQKILLSLAVILAAALMAVFFMQYRSAGHELSVLKIDLADSTAVWKQITALRADGYAIQLYKLDTPEKIEEYNQEQAERHAKGIEKRYKDLKTMIAGFAEVMSREQIIEAAKTAIMHRLEADDEDYRAHEGGMPLEYGIRQLEDIITECLQMMPEDNE